MITIDVQFGETFGCRSGRWSMTVRCQKEDRELIQRAAAQLGMPAAEFVRCCAYHAADQVLHNGGEAWSETA